MTLRDLQAKHEKLKKLDSGRLFKSAIYKTFGSDTHRYKFNPCLTENTLQNFEKTYSIILPSDYRNFLTQIGNGGSGPAYGLFALSDWNFKLEIDDNNFLATEFPHTEEWNMTKDFDRD